MKSQINNIQGQISVEKPKKKMSQKQSDNLAKGREKAKASRAEGVKKARATKAQKKKELEEKGEVYHYNKPNSITSKMISMEDNIKKSVEHAIKNMMEMNNKQKEPIRVPEVAPEKVDPIKLEEDLAKQKKELEEKTVKYIIENKIEVDEQFQKFMNKNTKQEYQAEDVKKAVPVKISKLPFNIRNMKAKMGK